MENYKSQLIGYLILLAVLLIPDANALIINCQTSPTPYYNLLDNKIRWVCDMSKSTLCLSYIRDAENNIIDVYPDIDYIDYIGESSYFNCSKTCTIYFKTNYILTDHQYNFTVECENASYTKNITPTYYLRQYQIAERFTWTQGNIGGIILATLIIMFILIAILFLIKLARGK